MKKLIFVLPPVLSVIWTMAPLAASEPAQIFPDAAVSSGLPGSAVSAQTDEVNPLKDRRHFNKLSKAGDRIYKVTMRSNVVFKLQTAVGHVSLIDLPEDALKVFIGDADLFKVEVYEKEVLIKPVTDYPNAGSNLTIFTASGRLSFQVSVGPPETADFVLDFRLPEEDAMVENAFKKALDEKYGELEGIFDAKTRNVDQAVENLVHKKMRQDIARGAEVIKIGKGQIKKDVKLELLTLSNVGDKSYLSFKIENGSRRPYKVSHAALGFERTKRIWLGLRKVSVGFVEISSQLDVKSLVPPNETVYGVIMFDQQYRDKKETPVVRVFEEDGDRHFKIRGFKWIP